MKNQKKKNDRLDEPTGRLGVPPDAPQGAGYTVIADCVIIVADRSAAIQILGRTPPRRTLPS